MGISEGERNDLYTGLSDAIGKKNTETLMKAVPLQDLDEVATKGDIMRVETRLEKLDRKVERLDSKVDRLTLILFAGLFGIIATLIGVN